MKAFSKIIIVACLITSSSVFGQKQADSLGLPGDNFDLPGALELFKKSKTPEDFEKAINSNDNEINNLDLNADGEVDYVKVIDNKEGDAHTLVMQVAVTKGETQDVGVIEVEKTKDGVAHVQIVGDEELYGKDYIVEPQDETAKTSQKTNTNENPDDAYKSKNNNDNYNTGNSGGSYADNTNSNVVVNVYPWPMVQYIYTPAYVVWTSPWYYGYYPGWWNPWQPIYWRNHYWRSYHYHHYYHRAYYYRSPNVHKGYYGRRMSSETVRGHQRTGYYADKQIDYKKNIQPGRKYNSLPADADKKINNKRVGNEQNEMNQPKRNSGQSEQINNQPKNNGKNVINDQPKEIKSEPIKNTSQPNEINNSPKNNQQPKYENTQPVKQQPIKQQPPKNPVKQGSGGRNVGGSSDGGFKSGGNGRNSGSKRQR